MQYAAQTALEVPASEGLSPEEAEAIAVRNQKTSWFLRFPPEIRNTIYVYTLGPHRICLGEPLGLEDTIKYEGQYNVCDPDPLGHLLSITETCRQIHAECALLFFNINKFGGHSFAEDGTYDEFLDSITQEQRKSITHWWTVTCCVTCVKEIHAPLDRLPGIQSLIFEACDKQETPRDVHEAYIKDLVRQKAGREVSVFFDYTTRFVQDPFDQEDIDNDDYQSVVEHEEEQDGMSSDSEDEAILI